MAMTMKSKVDLNHFSANSVPQPEPHARNYW